MSKHPIFRFAIPAFSYQKPAAQVAATVSLVSGNNELSGKG
jgi:hypothetical protein